MRGSPCNNLHQNAPSRAVGYERCLRSDSIMSFGGGGGSPSRPSPWAFWFWFWLRALNLRAGGADLVETLSARPPRPDDQTELRLSKSLETWAIASGVPAPRLFLIDQTIVNAAAIGTSPKNSAVLVSRGLIDALSPAETEAAMGRLVAMICAEIG